MAVYNPGISGAITQELHKAKRLAGSKPVQAFDLFGGQGRNRTVDTRIFKTWQGVSMEFLCIP